MNVEGAVVSKNQCWKSYTVSVGDTTYGEGDEIPLEVGVNKLTVTCNGTYGKSRTYTIDVTRRTAAKQATFEIPGRRIRTGYAGK